MTYDDAGNMLTRKKYSYTTGTLGSVLSTQTLTYGNATWGDVLTAINGTAVTSDAIGNVLNDGTWTYTWKNGRQLATMSKSGVTWSFAYDASGMRTQRTNGSTTYNYTYDDSTLVRMTVGNNTLIFTYGVNSRPMAVNYNGVDYYYVTNAQGDVIAIVNSAGAEVVTYTYDAWGNILSTGGPMASTLGAYNPLRYRGYVYDQETGLYYLQSRYYDPHLCRFINADTYVSTGQGILGHNMFAYCRNNPVSRKDALGTADISYTKDDETPWNDMIPDNLGRGGSGAGGAGAGGADAGAGAGGAGAGAGVSAGTGAGGAGVSTGTGIGGGNVSTIGGRGQLRTNMLKEGPAPGPGYQAHHGLPWANKGYFDRAGININDPQYGRWVNNAHQSWSYRYGKVWSDYISRHPIPDANDIIDFFNRINGLK